MSAPKRQHFIPCSYLKFFSATGDWSDPRKTQIWFADGEISRLASIENLGVEKYTYSKENPTFDHQFNQMEGDYPRIIEKLLLRKSGLQKREYFGLFMMMVDFNLRNVAYENKSEVERMHVYEGISKSFNREVFGALSDSTTDMREMLRFLERNWRLQPIKSKTGEKFISSDNPSTIFNHPANGLPVIVYLPAHPDLGLVAYDRRYINIKHELINDNALAFLNGLQINRSVRHTFADHDLSEEPEAWSKIQGIVAMEKPTRWVDGERWNPDFISIASPSFGRLSFLERATQKKLLAQVVREAIDKGRS